MPLESEQGGRIAAALVRAAENGADTARIADAIISMWRQAAAALRPIVGQHGFEALYKRSLHVAGSTHPWLAGLHEGVQPAFDLAAMKSLLLLQTSAAAAAAGGALLQSFCDVLASLVGSSACRLVVHRAPALSRAWSASWRS